MVKLEEDLAKLLVDHDLTMATAESCTGGLIANKITNIAGSSRYFERGVVSYSNRSKMDLLNVSAETLEKYGAVSKETAVAMATGIKASAGTDLGLGVTGIAGPDGGTTEKPVGLVYIALAHEKDTIHFKFNFDGPRETIKAQSAEAGLKILIEHIKG